MIYILTWNPTKWTEAQMQGLIDHVALDPTYEQQWKFASHSQPGLLGERVFLMRTGRKNPGLVASGHIRRLPFSARDFEDTTKQAWYVGVQFDHLISTPSGVIAPKAHLENRLKPSPRAFTPQACGVAYKGDEASLLALWQELTD